MNCSILDISRVTLWNWDKKGITKPILLGNLKRYKLEDINKLLKKTDALEDFIDTKTKI